MKKTISVTIAVAVLCLLMTFGFSASADEITVSDLTSTDCVSIEYNQATYNGSEIMPNVTVTYYGAVLTNGSDYYVTYTNNINCGTAAAIVTGINNYTGTVSKQFTIVPASVNNLSVSSSTSTSVSLKWSAVSGAVGYNVYKSTSSTSGYSLVSSTTSNTYKVSSLKNGTVYYFKVVAYGNSEKSILSANSNIVSAATTPKKVAISTVTKSGSSIKIKWKKTTCTGYQIQYSTDKKFKKSVKTVNVSSKSSSKTIKKVSKSKTYYARVRAYASSSTSTVYGSYSNKLSTNYSKLYATYSSNYVNNPSRTTNLRLACKEINGTIVAPGDTFSFNKTVGKRTSAKGYKKAHVFTGSTSMVLGTGGGVCQVASTMFNTALIANVKISERHQHSQRVTYVPRGRDAAIYWNSEDFKWTNNTGHPIKIVMKCSGGKITCSFYVCDDVSHKKVKLTVNRSGSNYTLKRTVGGKVNYSCRSRY